MTLTSALSETRLSKENEESTSPERQREQDTLLPDALPGTLPDIAEDFSLLNTGSRREGYPPSAHAA